MELFESWTELGRVALTAALVYLGLIFFLRLFGTRSTAKMNNFDWIVTVAMGSLLATVILSKDVVVLEGLLGIFTLLLLQYLATKITFHSVPMRRALRNAPCLLFYEGTYVERAMRDERISKEELDSQIRAAGYLRRDDVRAIVLESNAEVSVIGWDDGEAPELLRGLSGFPPPPDDQG